MREFTFRNLSIKLIPEELPPCPGCSFLLSCNLSDLCVRCSVFASCQLCSVGISCQVCSTGASCGPPSVCPGGSIVCPDGSLVCPQGTLVCPGGSNICPGGSRWDLTLVNPGLQRMADPRQELAMLKRQLQRMLEDVEAQEEALATEGPDDEAEIEELQEQLRGAIDELEERKRRVREQRSGEGG
jgi:hypothetical protein